MEVDFYSYILIFIRILVFVSLCRIIFPSGSSTQLKVGFSIILSYLIYIVLSQNNSIIQFTGYAYIIAILNEVMIGIFVAIITNILFDILNMAGSMIDTNMGLSMATIFDPTTQAQSTVSGRLLYYGGAAIFFAINGHQILIKSIYKTYTIVPLGNSILINENLFAAINRIIELFAVGFKIALPIILIVLLTDICMGLISRVVPQINVMVIGVPVKILIGLMTLAIALPLLLKTFENIAQALPEIIEKLFPNTAGVTLAFALGGGQERTEEATPKKKEDSRKKGQVAKSKDVPLAITMIGIIIVLSTVGPYIVDQMKELIEYYCNLLGYVDNELINIKTIQKDTITKTLKLTLLFILPITVLGVIGNILQTGFLITLEPLKPSLSKLNPISGFKNMFSKKNWIELIKNILIVSVVIFISYSFMEDKIPEILNIINFNYHGISVEITETLNDILVKIAILLVVLAVIDYFIQFRLHKSELKMTKQEVLEEFKQMEGNPEIKARIKQRQREISQRKMMDSIPDATVVITNPTHYAIVLKYTEGENSAPVVVAKGQNLIAQKIKDIARENNIPIIENKPLARMLYAKIDIGMEISEEFYQPVVEILAMLDRINRKN